MPGAFKLDHLQLRKSTWFYNFHDLIALKFLNTICLSFFLVSGYPLQVLTQKLPLPPLPTEDGGFDGTVIREAM